MGGTEAVVNLLALVSLQVTKTVTTANSHRGQRLLISRLEGPVGQRIFFLAKTNLHNHLGVELYIVFVLVVLNACVYAEAE